MRLQHKVTLVTGGGSGIGAAICVRFAQEGATVVVADINIAAAQTVAAGIVESGGNAMAKHQDVTDEARWPELIEEITSDWGQLDVLVNNAGIGGPATVESETLEGWRKTQAINSDAVFMGTRAAVAAMKSSGGSIINVSSIEGIIGEPLAAAYNASKGAVRIFTKSAALHCAANDYPVRVNSLHPGYVGTPLVENAISQLLPEEGEAYVARVLGNIPMKRMADPVEIANGALFLASDEASYMTGSELVIDGGYTAH